MKGENMSFRLSAATREHLEALGRRYGSMTAALEIAVDRMWRAEGMDRSEIEGITVYATDDGLDPMGALKAEHRDDAWELYSDMMLAAMRKEFPGVAVEVRREAHHESVVVSWTLGTDYDQLAAVEDVANQVYQGWGDALPDEWTQA